MTIAEKWRCTKQKSKLKIEIKWNENGLSLFYKRIFFFFFYSFTLFQLFFLYFISLFLVYINCLHYKTWSHFRKLSSALQFDFVQPFFPTIITNKEEQILKKRRRNSNFKFHYKIFLLPIFFFLFIWWYFIHYFFLGLPYIRLIPKVTAVSGETLHLKCPVAGYPIEEIHWERGNICSIKIKK